VEQANPEGGKSLHNKNLDDGKIRCGEPLSAIRMSIGSDSSVDMTIFQCSSLHEGSPNSTISTHHDGTCLPLRDAQSMNGMQ
jgi:hypothetical protein